MKSFIYQIWFPTSNKSYIGQAVNLKNRMLRHLNSDSLVGRALRKYDDWKICILHTCKTHDAANLIEIEEIRNFNSVAPDGYNITRGGGGSIGLIHSEDTKEQMKQSAISRGSNNKGFKHTEEWRREKSESMRGKTNASGHKKSKTFRLKWLRTRIKTLSEESK